RFIFANFEDFDMLYGHRSDPQGFAKCLEEFDLVLAKLIDSLRADDLLILTADHGNDPTDDSTDHTREYVPVALVNHGTKGGNLGDVDGFSSVGTTVATWLGLESPPVSLHRGTNLL
ncbi:MAG: alkaline phosphatase family protein, partial [Fimbriimonadaceae bacterium]|nr:alkaline phosphatase family protein [Fimbriimonadaceae bacterium]